MLAGILANNSRLGVFSENKDLLRDPVEGVLQQEEVLKVCIYNLKGDLLKSRARDGKRTPEKTIIEEPGRPNEMFEKLEASGLPFYIEGDKSMDFWSPVISGSGYFTEESLFYEEIRLQQKDRIIGFVRITIGKEMLNTKLYSLLINSMIIGIVFLLIGSLFMFFIIKGITRPLNRLTAAVKTFGHGSDIGKVPVETRDQIGRLARALNDMSESLKKREAEKEQLGEQLRHAQTLEAIGTLAGGIAHDFNNILGVILGYTELAMLELPREDDPLRHNLSEVMRAGKRARDLVDQILVFSRKTKQERKPIQMAPVVKEALRMLRSSLPSTIEIRQNIDTEPATLVSDPTEIHRVLMNLCTNAAHAMRDEIGVLEVSLTDVEIDAQAAAMYPDLSPGPYQRLTVSDTGHGVDSEIVERIFDPFFTTKKVGEGTGMGLAVVHGIVKSHNGAITVQSELGKGTTFNAFFPTFESGVTKEPELTAALQLGDERILFVDDELALVDTGRQILESLGYEVVARTSSIEALGVFQVQPDKFDLIITDMTMPNMTGVDLAKEVMRIRPGIPVILCTGFSEAITEDKAKAAGIRQLVMKPVIRQEIATAIRKALDQLEQ